MFGLVFYILFDNTAMFMFCVNILMYEDNFPMNYIHMF